MTMHRLHPIFDDETAKEWGLSKPDRERVILYDDCDRCAEHAEHPLMSLDDSSLSAMWDQMVIAEHDTGFYRTGNEGKAGRELYRIACFLERMLEMDPWMDLGSVRHQVR